MKRLVLAGIFCVSLKLSAQDTLSYSSLLQTAEEWVISDSILIDAGSQPHNLIDTPMVKSWLSSLLPSTPNNRLKRRNYYLNGKITRHEKFDILLVQEEKKQRDSTDAQVMYLITLKKDGTYIASLEASISGVKRNSVYNTHSWLYPDFRLLLLSRMQVNKKLMEDTMKYHINNGGRFILEPKY